ncbi:metal ABC transporter ATP-binding protein [Bacillus sp. HMF5848]|uniref:metal ABC transporter ATP-binding protein n=1 Tax=Bacillus sp. HMF5848 TaxID=2495421 RepID=UPI000F77760F|nr:metal ABC transporter ATP-binding protein [Bacillus sp. HMF5848]RSK27865.1 metal ABC transporter ATP-binding protein [Bacillus sp. HMF5848]
MIKHNVLEISNLYYRYDKELVLDNIDLSIPEGSFLALVGPNGSGKSTLIKSILRLLQPQQGNITLFGEDINKFKNWYKVGYVSQKANSFNSGFPATVFEVVRSGLVSKKGLFSFFTKEDEKQVYKALESVNMVEFNNRNIGELSGGQQQRVFIARAIVSNPSLLILDEPTVGIDAEHSQKFYDLLAYLNQSLNITLLMVTHEVGTVSKYVTHVACMNKHLHFHGNTEEFEALQDHDVSAFYGHNLQVIKHDHVH